MSDSNTYYVVYDENSKAREAFVVDDTWESHYSGYRYMDITFTDKAEAEAYASDYNSYKGVPDVQLTCCSEGCTMSPEDYDRWNGRCTYMGRYETTCEFD